jgi:hypothetical protein
MNTISTNDLRRMNGKEGLILQGCGGDLQEWVDGINEILTKEEILKDGTKFTDVSTFEYEDSTCLLFALTDDLKLNVGKLAMWRLMTRDTFDGMWLSDFVDNRLGGFISEKEEPRQKLDCPLIGQDGNIFNLMGIASRTLKENGMRDEAKELCRRIPAEAQNYGQALAIIGEYVNITGIHDEEDASEDWDEEYDKGMGEM